MARKYEKPKAIVRVYRPELTPEERERRMEEVKKAAIELLIAVEERKMRAQRDKENGDA